MGEREGGVAPMTNHAELFRPTERTLALILSEIESYHRFLSTGVNDIDMFYKHNSGCYVESTLKGPRADARKLETGGLLK